MYKRQGVHSNGFSLIRKILNVSADNVFTHVAEFGRTLGEELLTPTRIYVRPVLEILKSVSIKGASHITGGGFYENIPRMLPDGICAEVDSRALPVPPVFSYIAKVGQIDDREMYNLSLIHI